MPSQKPQKHLSSLPKKPGVYQFFGADGNILYIGKAKNLRNRVRTYFEPSAQLGPHKAGMAERVKRIETIVTPSEQDALILESTLIKKHQPPYNIDLKDDKNFLYIKVTANEDFPRVFTVRKMLSDRARYFGPFTSAESVRQTLRLLRRLFPHRNFEEQPRRRQLEYLTRRYPELLGPEKKSLYGENIQNVIRFLEGKYDVISEELDSAMRRASAEQRFERAARYRDALSAIKRIQVRQRVVSHRRESFDVAGIAREDNHALISLLAIRDGKLFGKQDFTLEHVESATDEEIIETFIERYYLRAPEHARTVFIPLKIAEQLSIERLAGIRVIVPLRGEKKSFLKIAQSNAREALLRMMASTASWDVKIGAALRELSSALSLPSTPRRIECYDISNIQGTNAVGSMVVFEKGLPAKAQYRKFSIRTVSGANDPAMLAEILERRFAETHVKQWGRPDLIILDGGKGQLSAVRERLGNRIETIPIAALAKRHEELFLPNRDKPVRLRIHGEAYYLIQRIRDEAHRFAIGYYRKRHGVSTMTSLLDEIPGIGPKMKRILIKEFGSVQLIRQASQARLAKVVGRTRAKSIISHLS